jgi:hypothetical protein
MLMIAFWYIKKKDFAEDNTQEAFKEEGATI